MENCYNLELPGVEPAAIQMELPELPLGTKFISSKKEEFISENGQRGTLITLWFTFAYSGDIRISPLLTRINGRLKYFEFEPVTVYENPNLISPKLEIAFENPNNLITDKKSGKTQLKVRQGEKFAFILKIRYCLQITDFKWIIPKDSIFTETERFEFANGTQRSSQFTSEAKNLSRFEWQILKEGTYQLPQILVGTLAFNGSKKTLTIPKNIEIIVSGEKLENTGEVSVPAANIFESAFTKTESAESYGKNALTSRSECEKLASKEHLTIFQKLFGRRYAIFAGGLIFPIPETKSNGQNFSGGQKIKITEKTENWSFIECEEFSGWTKNENLFEIK